MTGDWVSANDLIDSAREEEIASDRGPAPEEGSPRRSSKPFPCDECDFRAVTAAGLEAHKARRHVDVTPEPLRPKGPQPLACKELDCSHVSESGQGAASHARMHAREKAKANGFPKSEEPLDLPIVELPSGVLLQGTKEITMDPERLREGVEVRGVRDVSSRIGYLDPPGVDLDARILDLLGRLGRLVWKDAYSDTYRQKPPFSCLVESVGWMLEGDEVYAEIASERLEKPDGEIEYRGMTYVPRSTIERFELL